MTMPFLSTGDLRTKTAVLDQSLCAPAMHCSFITKSSGSKMGHIRYLWARYSQCGLSLRVLGMAVMPAGGGSAVLRQGFGLIGALVVLALVLASGAEAQPRGTARAQQGPALPPTGHQTEPVDLNEGKSPAELFKAGCAVCHASPAGLAKGRHERELTGFLRQHYTSSVQHAAALAGYLAATAPARSAPVAAPQRQAPVERPPASVGRRTPDDDRKEAAREPASRRRPPAAAQAPAPRTAPAPTAAAEAAPEPEPAVEPSAPASPPPAEEKPAAQEKPPAPQIPL
jgi:hypothetical protein